MISEIKKSIKIKDIITLKEYIIDPSKLKNMKDLKLNEFIFIKYFSITNKTIELNNCSFIQKANDYQIFKILEQKINSQINLENKEDFFEIEPIKEKNKIKERCIFSKVVLKDRKKKFILILDKFNRIIKYDLKADDDIDLYDLILITNCYIIKSSEDKYIYELRLDEKKENSLFYVSKKLFFNKEIQINNYTILDIVFPDFRTKNYYNVIDLCDRIIHIRQKRQIYIFKFENEQFNEIVPFEIKFRKRKYTFKFFITHNIINKINILINCSKMNTCAIDHCYYNIYTDEIPYFINLYVDNEKYKIEHYNNFDSLNRIGFIVLNVPATEETKKIKDKEGEKQIKDNKGIISAQIWYIASKKENNNLTYDLIQILDVNEANKKIYYEYNLKDKKFEIFKDFYFEMINFYENWESEKYNIFKYFEIFSQKVEKIKEKLKLLYQYYNTDYLPDSADYYNYIIYANISLFQALQNLKKLCQNDFEDTLNVWKFYIRQYSNFLNKINNNVYKLTFHQKIRIIDAFCTNYFNSYKKGKKNINPCKFWNINDYPYNTNNSYALALLFNKNIIKNLKENSALTTGFLQLDSYILTNYFINKPMKTYSLSNEPLVLMKYHLLISYDDFLLIYYQPPKKNSKIHASFSTKNRITLINERIIFDANDSEYLEGKNNALPISMEFFHEKDSHSKKSLKNLKIKSPIVCYKYDINRSMILEESEDGRFIESLIGSQEFIDELKKSDNKLGELMKIEYFIDKDFKKLHEKYEELKKQKESNDSEEENEKQNIELDSINKKKIIQVKKKEELVTLEDYENYYLRDGCFVYPYSLPWNEYPINETPPKRPAGEMRFLQKYQKEIELGRKLHFCGEI